MQRVFDVENEQDMADLWNILSDNINKIIRNEYGKYYLVEYTDSQNVDVLPYVKINWHDKKEIMRPMQECTEQDMGKVCYFWTGKDYAIGILVKMYGDDDLSKYCMEDGNSGIWFAHCRRLTKQEIEELC